MVGTQPAGTVARRTVADLPTFVVAPTRRAADKVERGIGISGGVRVSFFDAHTIWRQVDWDLIGGRLWRWITIDYSYPDQAQTWRHGDAISSVETHLWPDDTGKIVVHDRRTPRAEGCSVTQLSGRSSDRYWLERPTFGDWDALADPGPSAYEVAGFEQTAPAM